MERIAAVLIAVPFWLATAFTGLWALWSTAITSTPFQPDGDPCCESADTWSEVWAGVAQSLIVTVVAGVLLAVAVAFSVYAAFGRWLRWRWLAALPVAGALLVGAVLAAALLDASPPSESWSSSKSSRTASK